VVKTGRQAIGDDYGFRRGEGEMTAELPSSLFRHNRHLSAQTERKFVPDQPIDEALKPFPSVKVIAVVDGQNRFPAGQCQGYKVYVAKNMADTLPIPQAAENASDASQKALAPTRHTHPANPHMPRERGGNTGE